MSTTFQAYINALTEDTAPDFAADFGYERDQSASGSKKVKWWRLSNSLGSDIASAGTLNLDNATGDMVDVTGTTGITAITLTAGREVKVRFTGILTLTHGASLILPTSANITTADGDIAIFRGYSGSVVRCVGYQRLTGAALAGSGGISGPGSSVDNAIVRWNGTGGTAIQDYTSGAPTISDTGVLTMQKQIVTKSSNGTSAGDISIIGDDNLSFPKGIQFDGTNSTVNFFYGGARYGAFAGAGEGWKVVSGLQFSWSSNGSDACGAASDTGLKRAAAKFVGATDGGSGAGGFWLKEMTAPSAPAANEVYIYAQDNGAGKTQIMALFSSGAAQQIAIQP